MKRATEIPNSEYENRINIVRKKIDDNNADAGIWFSSQSIEYLTGFYHLQTERPVVLIITSDKIQSVVPKLEYSRVKTNSIIEASKYYFDYPGTGPMNTIKEVLDSLNISSAAADMDGPPNVMGYEGPALSNYITIQMQSWVPEQRREKTSAEIAVMREASKWAHFGHKNLVEKIVPGAAQGTISQQTSSKTSEVMINTLGKYYIPRTGIYFDGPVHTGMHSGAQTADPHPFPDNRELKRGDTIVTAAEVNVDGYLSEIERTMFLGEPSATQREYYEIMLHAQQVGINACSSGTPVSEVASLVWGVFVEAGVQDYAYHHVGHGLGMGSHEVPYVDRGSDKILSVGDVITIEPGIYIDGHGGYRHSDPVVIHDDGIELLNSWPRDIDSNIIPV